MAVRRSYNHCDDIVAPGIQVENDVYCIYANRVNYEAKWSPVPPSIDVSTLSGKHIWPMPACTLTLLMTSHLV